MTSFLGCSPLNIEPYPNPLVLLLSRHTTLGQSPFFNANECVTLNCSCADNAKYPLDEVSDAQPPKRRWTSSSTPNCRIWFDPPTRRACPPYNLAWSHVKPQTSFNAFLKASRAEPVSTWFCADLGVKPLPDLDGNRYPSVRPTFLSKRRCRNSRPIAVGQDTGTHVLIV